MQRDVARIFRGLRTLFLGENVNMWLYWRMICFNYERQNKFNCYNVEFYEIGYVYFVFSCPYDCCNKLYVIYFATSAAQ